MLAREGTSHKVVLFYDNGTLFEEVYKPGVKRSTPRERERVEFNNNN